MRVEVSDLEETGDNVKLRMALVEPEIAYTGGNKVPLHHDVVRGFVGDGGVSGMALKEKSGRQVVTIDPAEVKKAIEAYLKSAADSNVTFAGTGSFDAASASAP